MKPVTVAITYSQEPCFADTVRELAESSLVESIVLIGNGGASPKVGAACSVIDGSLTVGRTLSALLDSVETDYVLIVLTKRRFRFEPGGLKTLLDGTVAAGGCASYADFIEQDGSEKMVHPVNDYQAGSVREEFDFGPVLLLSVAVLRRALAKQGLDQGTAFAGLYDLRLKASVAGSLIHVKQALSSVTASATPLTGDRLFVYVDPKNRKAQLELENVFTGYLKQIGAYIPAEDLQSIMTDTTSFPVEASIIIPVKNRRETVGDAIRSALSQDTSFPFNVLVIDNHSTDGTTALLSAIAAKEKLVRHIMPERTDLAIGGCWNLAIGSQWCGRYAVQLDSDDLYSDIHVAQRIVDTFKSSQAAMVVGSYTLVDFAMNVVPPGLIDHREWTDENGHNNGLRVNGFGAPRAFYTPLVRKMKFPNVSYGEDYAVTLRICREYRIARLFENLYFCRRWSGNTDAKLTVEQANLHDAFKDSVRSAEIVARQILVRQRNRHGD